MITIHPNAVIHESCVIGTKGFSFTKGKNRTISPSKGITIGKIYMASFCNVDLGIIRDTIIGNNTIIDSHVHISHDCIIGNDCEIDTGARILGGVTIGNNSRICTNAVIHPNVIIGDNCVVGANSYLRHNIPDGTLVYGTPANIPLKPHYKI